MRVLITSEHRYPSETSKGSGRQPKPFPSGSGNHISDLTVKGLAELGHDVVYCLPKGWSRPVSSKVTMVDKPVFDVDVAHVGAYRDAAIEAEFRQRNIPTVVNCHRDPKLIGTDRGPTGANWVFVSRNLAAAFGSDRFVHNGLDPDDYIFQPQKQEYLLFMAALEWARPKGLELALSLAREAGVDLVVAGTGLTQDIIDDTATFIEAEGGTFVGDVRGREKADLFAGAKAFLFPTQIPESFGLCLVEAMMSGTPVIASTMGACPEIVTPDTGFLCRTRADYLSAIDRCGTLSAEACRATAVRRFHYRRMAADYAREYQVEIARNSLMDQAV